MHADGPIPLLRSALLKWYDSKRRVLPWRALPGERADPYRVWISEIMLQQTTVSAVIPYFLKFVEKWPSVQNLAAAPVEDVLEAWAGLGYYARARNLHKCAGIVVQEHNGYFPENVMHLRALPGIGVYTAGAIAAIAFNIPAIALDGNGERVFARFFDISRPFPEGKVDVRAAAQPVFEAGLDDRAGDFVQAVMDLGATVCIPKKPSCKACPLASSCAGYKAGYAGNLPFRAALAEKPRKFGYVYIVCDESGRILVERRPEKGLLGGMLGLPTSEWRVDSLLPEHPEWLRGPEIRWEKNGREERVFHTFTHFYLELVVRRLVLDSLDNFSSPALFFPMGISKNLVQGMPSIFRKVLQGLVRKY